MDLVITLFVIFIILPAFFLFIFLYFPKTIRSWRLKKVANEFGLLFDNNMKKFSLSHGDSYQRNSIKGNLNNHSVELYDFYEYHPNGRYNYYRKFVVLIKDGQKTELRGGLSSVHKIRKALTDIGNS